MSFFIFHPPKLSKKACPHYGDRLAADAKYGSTSMNLSFHALVCRLVTQAHFIFATLGQVVPKLGPAADPRQLRSDFPFTKI